MGELVEQMQQAEFYPHEVRSPVKLLQTHASYIFLTGDYAYKVKKSVDYGFLDYSTLEKRRHFCQEELRLNQPIAPDIYLEVVAIQQEGDRFGLNGKGETVEYAVKMHQFPQDCLLSELFKQDKLAVEDLEAVGRVVARFHGRTTTNDYIRSFGSVEKIRQAIDNNYRYTQKYIGSVQTPEQYRETKAFTDEFFERRELFEQRRKSDRIRECHGDLHLRNMCWWHDKIQLFDRIEFNEPFRFVDVMYDVAFTAMDLEARGRKDLATVFLNSYLEQTGDWEGVCVLPLYLSRQAYVRAKVTSFLLDDAEVPETQKQEAAETASMYYRLAWKFTRTEHGRLFLMSGLSGSGKSTIAKYLAKHSGAIQIRSDAVRKHLAGMDVEAGGNEEIYTAGMSEKTYDRLLELGIMLAREGFPVILDARYNLQQRREEAIAAANRYQIPLKILACTAPMEVLKTRLEQRQGDISEATPRLLQHQQKTTEPFSDREADYVKIIDTTQDWRQQLQDLAM